MVLPRLYRIVGFCQLHAGRLQEARTSLELALELTSNGDLRHEHGYVMLGLAELAKAESDSRADELMRASMAALNELGVVSVPHPGKGVVELRLPGQYRLQDPLPA